MTDSDELRRKILETRMAQSLETIAITRGNEGEYVISSVFGVSICERRDTLQQILDQVLNTQDSYYRDEKGIELPRRPSIDYTIGVLRAALYEACRQTPHANFAKAHSLSEWLFFIKSADGELSEYDSAKLAQELRG